MSENAKKPRIRFKGFSDAWEQCKLGNVAAKVTEKNTQNKIKETFTNSAEMGVVSQRDFFDHDIAKADKIDGYYIVQENDFIYNPRISVTAPCGPINRNKLGRKGVMSPLYTVFRTNNINPLFLEWYFKSSCWYAYMYFNGDSGARSDRFSIKNELFFDMPIPLPKVDEQWRIGLLLESLNNLITLHQRKYDKLVAVKKSLLEKMFPAVGETVPKIRFKGFSDAWEQRKLDYYLEVSNIKNTDNTFTKEDVLSVSGDFGVVNQIEFQGRSFAGVSVSNYGIVQTGDVVYTKSPLKANPFGIIKTNKGKTGIVSVLYGVYHTKERANANFIQTYFEQDARLNNYLRPLVNKGAKNTLLISDTDALAGEVCFAPTLTEQCSVGQFFATLDNLITLHQRQLEKLKNIKSALLEKMFV